MEQFLSGKRLLLCGAGKMGSALLQGWLAHGISIDQVTVKEPNVSKWLESLKEQGLKVNKEGSQEHDLYVFAVKPQSIEEVIRQLNINFGNCPLFVSIAAGVKIAKLQSLLGPNAAIIRVMPNTPASVRKGVSCIIQSNIVSEAQINLTESLFSVVGKTIRLTEESQMDAVTAISGSGPAYVFHMIEALTAAGMKLGLREELAENLATLTVSGAGTLAEMSASSATKLRENVTSPNGTTEAALKVLMNKKTGFSILFRSAVAAAAARSRELDS